jgi:hypothetical protein
LTLQTWLIFTASRICMTTLSPKWGYKLKAQSPKRKTFLIQNISLNCSAHFAHLQIINLVLGLGL